MSMAVEFSLLSGPVVVKYRKHETHAYDFFYKAA